MPTFHNINITPPALRWNKLLRASSEFLLNVADLIDERPIDNALLHIPIITYASNITSTLEPESWREITGFVSAYIHFSIGKRIESASECYNRL